jgi:hypothetical protein
MTGSSVSPMFATTGNGRPGIYDGTAAATFASGSFLGTTLTAMSSWGPTGQNITANGGAVANAAFDGAISSTSLGIAGQNTLELNGEVAFVEIYTRQPSNADLQRLAA